VRGFNLNSITGRVEISASTTYSAADGLRVSELTIRGADLTVPAV
jgi:hypothetical protein